MIRLAAVDDAYLVHEIMLLAFEEYRNIDIPSFISVMKFLVVINPNGFPVKRVIMRKEI